LSLAYFQSKTYLSLSQAQSQGSITLKIIPAIKEEDRLKDSKVRNLVKYQSTHFHIYTVLGSL